jgi:hypothetical protein
MSFVDVTCPLTLRGEQKHARCPIEGLKQDCDHLTSMINWLGRQKSKSGETAAKASDHPDFDGKALKRKLVTLEDFNRHAQQEGLGSRVRMDLDFERAELQTLRDLWFEIADRKRTLPAYEDFDEAILNPFMPHIGIIDCIPQDNARSRYRVRFQGRELARLLGDQTGHFIDEFLPKRILIAWEMGYDMVIDAGRPVRIAQKLALPLLSHLDAETFSAPLGTGGKSARGLLTALYPKPKEGVIADGG